MNVLLILLKLLTKILIMKSELIQELLSKFETACYEYNGIECWSARELQTVFNYTEWRNFIKIIDKAKVSCENAGENIDDHFVEFNKMINIAKGAQRQIDDMALDERGVKPELLPPDEDVKKVQRRLECDVKNIGKQTKKLKNKL